MHGANSNTLIVEDNSSFGIKTEDLFLHVCSAIAGGGL